MIDLEQIENARGQEFQDYVKSIVKDQSPKRHRFYSETVLHAKQMGVHIEGHEPKELLRVNRPNEPEEVKKYRLAVWKSITKSLSDKILNTVARIFNPKFFRIEFPENPGVIPEDEELGKYLTEDFGIYKSLWVFVRETLLKISFSDPNSLCLIIPENPKAEEQEYYRPIPIIYRAEHVVDFVDGEYYTVWIPPVKEGTRKKDHKEPGHLIIITKKNIRAWFIKGKDQKLILELEYDFDETPAFRLGAQVQGQTTPYYFTSFVQGIQPHWDKVVTMTSDLDGSTVNHLYPTMWEWTDECQTCSGRGTIEKTIWKDDKIIPVKGQYISCTTCNGTGKVTNRSPFGVHQVKREALNADLPLPVPPAGFVTKDIVPLQELKKSIETEVLAGYSAINMEVLFTTGENQSGIAKTIDRQDFDSFLMRVFQHIFDCNVEPIIRYTALWRMSDVLGVDKTNDYIDEIKVSKRKDFTIIGLDMLMQELEMAKSSNHIRFIEKEIINNRFASNEAERKKNLAIIDLKPFPGKSTDELLSSNSMGAISKQDLIRNENIDDLVNRALSNDEGFLELPYEDQLGAINDIINESYLTQEDGIPTPSTDELIETDDGGEGDN